MFTPKWKKEALHLSKGASKFIDYKRDLLGPDRVAEIESRRQDLLQAVKEKNQTKVNEASKQLRHVCDKALPYQKPVGWLEENVEVMFVAIVIALGLRAYYLQPFRIPTGSMQPTLNGIIGTPLAESQWPSLPQRLIEQALRGRSYVKVVNDQDRKLPYDRQTGMLKPSVLGDTQYMHFFSRSILVSENAPPLMLPAPSTVVSSIGFGNALNLAARNGGILPAGAVICEGFVDTGDLVLVDKVSYHFRKPKRGEVFVFDTTGIEGIQKRSGPQGAGSHYIKRLCGVPGDTLKIQSPNLMIDGKVAQEPGIQRVIQAKGEYSKNQGYELAKPEGAPEGQKPLRQYITHYDSKLTLAADAPPGMREYAALGDNTGNSLDSRYWGPVKEFNLVGPALFSLWPFTTGHWGFIR